MRQLWKAAHEIGFKSGIAKILKIHESIKEANIQYETGA